MVETLGATRGITKVHVDRDDPAHPKLCLHYEPTSVRLEEIEALVKSTGAEIATVLRAEREAERASLRAAMAVGLLRPIDEEAVMAVMGIALTTLSSAKPAMATLIGVDMDDEAARERLAHGIADLLLHGLLPR